MEEMERVRTENRMLLRKKVWIYITAMFFSVASASMGIRLYLMHVRGNAIANSFPVPAYASASNICSLWYVWAFSALMVIVGFIFIVRNIR